MTLTKTDFLKIIHDTKAVSIWNHHTGPVFWYAASVPGPFYVNTELVIGPALSAQLLEKITAILAATADASDRSAQVETLIMTAYQATPVYQQIIETMAEKTKESFDLATIATLSGGERRDWLFSIPLAKILGIPHAYLFKNHDLYCATPLQPGGKALHVADLINNAASYFDAWFPILEANKLVCAGTVCVNTRGTNGLDRLKAVGQKVVALNNIDIGFFEDSKDAGIIDEGTLEEVRTYFESSKGWASRYLLNNTTQISLFDIDHLDGKSKERLRHFFIQDPWQLGASHADFFDAMKKAVG